MGFEIEDKRDPSYRKTLTERDRVYLQNCRTCDVQELCGGWSIYNDARWCQGPDSKICWDGCRAICSRNPEKVDYFTQLLDPQDISWRDDPDNGFPWAVPDLSIQRHKWLQWDMDWPDVGFQLNAHANWQYQPLYTVSLKHLFYAGRDTWSPQKDLKARFQIPEESCLAITMTTHDKILDELEPQMDRFYDEIAEYENVDFVLAPNFSIYNNYPRMDNLFRNKFRFMGMEKLQERGVKVVPSIYYVTKTDFHNVVAWMRDNQCNVFMMNAQTVATTTGTREWLAFIRRAVAIRDSLDFPVRLMLYGGVGGDRQRSVLEEYGPDVTFIDAKSYRLAEYHKDIDEKVDRDIDVKELFHLNANARREQIAKIKNRAPVPAIDCTPRITPIVRP